MHRCWRPPGGPTSRSAIVPGSVQFIRRVTAVALAAISTAAAVGVLAPSPALAHHTSDTFVTGTFRYADRNPDSGTVTLRPISHAKVEIWRFAPRTFGVWSWGVDATTTTNANGVLSIHMPFQTSGIVYGVKVFATNYAAVVWPNDAVHTVPFHQEPGEPDGRVINRTATASGQTLDFSYDFRDSWTPQHFNLAETVRRGYDFATARRDPAETDRIKPADVQPTSVTGSWYNPTADTVVITSGDVFADFLILHEYAHFLQEQISSFAWIPSSHDGCTARDGFGNVINSAEHAWMEGFASWLPQAVNRYLPPGLLTGRGQFGSTPSAARLERPPDCSFSGDTVENFVAASLYDLVDQTGDPGTVSEPFDKTTRLDRAILQIFDKELDVYGVWPTMWHFRDAWIKRGLSANALDHVLSANRIPVPAPRASPRQGLGYDGDGKADFAVWRPSNGTWYVINSSTGQSTARQWGLAGDIPTPGDFDGDGKADFAVWRPSNGTWYVISSSTGQSTALRWDEALLGDIPTPGDFDGDGRHDFAVWRPSSGTWYVINRFTGATSWTVLLGRNGDVPQVGDFDGDGRDDFSVWTPSLREWQWQGSKPLAGRQIVQMHEAQPGDIPQVGDFDGDGRFEIALWRPSTGEWALNGPPWKAQLGRNGDVPQGGDFDGDGRHDLAVWRPSTGMWLVVNSSTGTLSYGQWGLSGDVPVVRVDARVAAPGVASLSLNPNSVIGGSENSTGTVTIDSPASGGGFVVGLTSSNPTAASVPASVTVPAGSSSASFAVRTQRVGTDTSVTISASGGDVVRTAVVTLTTEPAPPEPCPPPPGYCQ